MLKSITVGFPKAGTLTIHRALVETGFASAHYRVRTQQHGTTYIAKLCCDAWQGNVVARGHLSPFDSMPIAECLNDVSCIEAKGETYFPVLDMDFLDYVRAWYPDCLFVLNTRPIKDHIASIRRWGDLSKRIIKADLPYLPRGKGVTDRELSDWIKGHYQRCRDRGDVLEVDITTKKAPRKIGEALGVKLAWWGQENKRA